MFEIKDVIGGCEFIKRINKYMGELKIKGKVEKAFISNPGRLEDLLIKGVGGYVKKVDNSRRKTKYDLLCIENKEGIIVGIDSRIPNKLFEYLIENNRVEELKGYKLKRREYRIGKSRIDYLFERNGDKYLVELKICTLVKNKVMLFPDAVSARSTKHLRDLIRIKSQGYRPIVYFLGLRRDPESFSPNGKIDPEFEEAYKEALKEGIEIFPVKSRVDYKSQKLIFSEFEKILLKSR
ncbi:MAG: DNA/RNA nuclease SfsA [Candidatus Helarchaeota archaeon]